VKIAYLINQYPAVSHSFIRREILALEQMGLQIMRISLRGWDLELVDEQDRRERERTRYVLRSGAPALLLAVMRMLMARPLRFFRTLSAAWRMSRGSSRPLHVHFIYVAEACLVEPWLRQAKVEHLHAHFGTNSAEVAMFVHILGGTPWSLTVHGPEDFLNSRQLHLPEKIQSAKFTALVCWFGVSQVLLALKPQYWHRLHVIHCGVDPIFLNAAANVVSLPRRLVCIARLAPEKGHIILLEAVRRLAAEKVDFQLVLVGDGELRSEIEALIAQYGLADRVRLTGSLSGKQVRDEVLAARALVLPSFAEGLPVVIMEAMALRRPVVSTFIAGIPELVRPGQEGWLVPAGDATALAAAIRSCLEAPTDLIKRMGDSARERVLAQHDVMIEAAKLKKLFNAAEDNGQGSLLSEAPETINARQPAQVPSGRISVPEGSHT